MRFRLSFGTIVSFGYERILFFRARFVWPLWGNKQWKWIQFSSALKVSSLVWPLLHKLFGDSWKILLLRCGRTWFSVKSSIGFVQNWISGALRGRALIFNHLNIIECKVFCNIFVLCKRRERCGGVGLARSVGEAIFLLRGFGNSWLFEILSY